MVSWSLSLGIQVGRMYDLSMKATLFVGWMVSLPLFSSMKMNSLSCSGLSDHPSFRWVVENR